MRLIILIPTFQRPSTLVWSLQSVIRQKFANLKIEKKIFVLNNDPNYREKVNQSVSFVLNNNIDHEFDHIEILQGDTTIPSIKNMYGNLQRLTQNDDIAIIHGDDDILLPNTLEFRVESAMKSDKQVLIANALMSCSFLLNREGIFLSNVKEPYQRGISYDSVAPNQKDISTFSLPFISIYTYKINKTFWKIFDTAIHWADELPFAPKIKYPFVPYFIGLSAHHYRELAVADVNIVIRGQLFSLRKFLPPKTVTEYANGGIILLTGLAILNNSVLSNDSDFDDLRVIHRKSTLKLVFQSFTRRDGVSLKKLFELYKIAKANFSIKEFTPKIILLNIRHLFDNLLFTQNISRIIKGWGPETHFLEFWKNWDENNIIK